MPIFSYVPQHLFSGRPRKNFVSLFCFLTKPPRKAVLQNPISNEVDKISFRVVFSSLSYCHVSVYTVVEIMSGGAYFSRRQNWMCCFPS